MIVLRPFETGFTSRPVVGGGEIVIIPSLSGRDEVILCWKICSLISLGSVGSRGMVGLLATFEDGNDANVIISHGVSSWQIAFWANTALVGILQMQG